MPKLFTKFLTLALVFVSFPKLGFSETTAISAQTGEGFFRPETQEMPALIQRYWNSVGMVVVSAGADGYEGGSGMVFQTKLDDPSNKTYSYLLTNLHVAKERCTEKGEVCKGLSIRFGYKWQDHSFVPDSSSSFQAVFDEPMLAYVSSKRDMVVLKFENPSVQFPRIDLVRDPNTIGDNQLVTIGYPILEYRTGSNVRPIENSWATGRKVDIYTNSNTGVSEGTLLLTNIDLLPGMSGCPIIDAEGRFVGIQELIIRKDPSGSDFSYQNIQFIIGLTFDELPVEIQ